MGQGSFCAHRLVFPGAPRALGLYQTSRCSLANEPFGAHKFLNQMRFGDSDEIAGRRRVLSSGPSLRLGREHFKGILGRATDPRFELRSTFPVRSIFVSSCILSELGLHPTGCANLVLRSDSEISERRQSACFLESCER